MKVALRILLLVLQIALVTWLGESHLDFVYRAF